MKTILSAILLTLLHVQPLMAADAVDDLLARYSGESASVPDPSRGEALWKERHGDHSCTTCHGPDLTRPGKHVRTGRKIDPMAPSVNPRRLTRERKIEKWFLRNCKWAWGRVCSPGEKADILAWLKQQ